MPSQFPGGPDEPEHSIHIQVPTREVTPEQESLVVRMVSSLGTKMETLGRKLGRVEELANRTRRLTLWITGIGVVSLLAVAGVLIVFGIALGAKNSATDASAHANLNTKYLTDSCIAANQTRSDQRELWGAVITVSSQSDVSANPLVQLLIDQGVFTKEEYTVAVDTPTAAAGLTFIRDKVATIFADRDCSKVAEGKVK